MKPGEAIHTGMRVWDREGRTWEVLSVFVPVDKNDRHSVVLNDEGAGPLAMMTAVPFDTFVKDYYCRRTAWEHCARLDLKEPVYEGPAKGYHYIRFSIYEGGTIRIPERIRRAKEAVRAELEEARRKAVDGSSGYTEWYEHAKPEGAWALVLEPTL